MARGISNRDDIIDSRDVIARIKELEDELTEPDGDYCYGCNLALDPPDPDDPSETDEDGRAWHLTCKEAGLRYDDGLDEEREELEALKALAEQGEAHPDWPYGAALIRESYIDGDYAFERAVDFGYISDRDSMYRWPFNNMDWRAAAEDLKADATEVDFDGVTYYVGL